MLVYECPEPGVQGMVFLKVVFSRAGYFYDPGRIRPTPFQIAFPKLSVRGRVAVRYSKRFGCGTDIVLLWSGEMRLENIFLLCYGKEGKDSAAVIVDDNNMEGVFHRTQKGERIEIVQERDIANDKSNR